MKIWVIGRSYPGKKNKMSGSFELEQAKLLASRGHEVIYMCCVFHPVRKVKNWGLCSWCEDNVHIYAYSQFYFPGRLHIYLNMFQKKVWGKLLNYVENCEGVPDIIHVHYPTLLTQPEVILSYKAKGTKIVVTEHWTAVQTGRINSHEIEQLKTYVSESDYFICVGKPLKDKIQELTQTSRELIIIPNVVPNYFVCKSKNWDGFRFVGVGRLVPVKQFDHLIRVFWQVYSDINDVTLTIVGGGSEYKRLKKLVYKLGANERIKLTGTLPRNKTADIISSSDVLVCSSRLETFGVPVIEAWYCGLPVITTDAIGFAELFDESLGMMIHYNDDNQLAICLRNVIDGFSNYSKEFIHNYAVDNFSEDAIYKKLIEIYIS